MYFLSDVKTANITLINSFTKNIYKIIDAINSITLILKIHIFNS